MIDIYLYCVVGIFSHVFPVDYRPQVDSHLYKVEFIPVRLPEFPTSLELALKGINYTPLPEEVMKYRNMTFVVQVKVQKGRASVYRHSNLI